METLDLALQRNRQAVDVVRQYGTTLYHYTSLYSLDKILTNKQLAINSTRTMNDQNEVRDFIQNLDQAIEQDIDPSFQSLRETFFQEVYLKLDSAYPFASCFSALEDDAALWQRYADAARGVCIGLNTETLFHLFYGTPLMINTIYYQYDIRDHQLYRIVKDYLSSGALDDDFADRQQLIETIIATGSLRKHASFQSEREFRLVSLYVPEFPYAQTEFREHHGEIRKYMNIDLAQLAETAQVSLDSLFTKIILGPFSTQNVKILEEFVAERGFKTLSHNVIRSSCPLRQNNN